MASSCSSSKSASGSSKLHQVFPAAAAPTNNPASSSPSSSTRQPHHNNNHHHHSRHSQSHHHSSSNNNSSHSYHRTTSSRSNSSSQSQTGHQSHNRHQHMLDYRLMPDSYPDGHSSSSSLSSTASSATIVTSSSSSSSSSSTSNELDPKRQSKSNQPAQSVCSKVNATGMQMDCKQMNDLNTGLNERNASNARRTRKSISECTSGHDAAVGAASDNWTTFHFGPQNHVTTTVSSTLPNGMIGRMSPRCDSDLFASRTLDQRMGSSSGVTSRTTSSGKAVAVIKGTASSTTSSSSRMSSNSLHGSNNSDWKKHLHSHEVRKLKRELDQSEEKVISLSSQLATHSHMVTAFEQSLANMSLRLQQMTSLSAQKDSEIQRLQNEIEELRTNCGTKITNLLSDGKYIQRKNQESPTPPAVPPSTPIKKSLTNSSSSSSSSSSASSNSVPVKVKGKENHSNERKNSNGAKLIRRHTFVSSTTVNDHQNLLPAKESSSRTWFKAFRRSSNKNKPNASDQENSSDAPSQSHSFGRTSSIDSLQNDSFQADQELVVELKRQLREKEKTVTDLRLESLATAHQLQSLEELVTQLRSEIAELRAENERFSNNKSKNSSNIKHVICNGSSDNEVTGNSISGIEWPTSDRGSGYESLSSVFFPPAS